MKQRSAITGLLDRATARSQGFGVSGRPHQCVGLSRGWSFAVGLGRACVVREETPVFHEAIQPSSEPRRQAYV